MKVSATVVATDSENNKCAFFECDFEVKNICDIQTEFLIFYNQEFEEIHGKAHHVDEILELYEIGFSLSL